MTRRVVVTGFGVVSALGQQVEEFWQRCLAGEGPVESIPDHWREFSAFSSTVWSPLPALNFDAGGISAVEAHVHDSGTLQALAATDQAWRSAGLTTQVVDPRRNKQRLLDVRPEGCGVFFGSGMAGLTSVASNLTAQAVGKALGGRELAPELAALKKQLRLPRRFHPLAVPLSMPNASASAIGIKYSLLGPARTFSSACAAGTVAIGNGYLAVANGEVDLAVCGASEHLYDEYGAIFRGFDIVGALVRAGDSPASANRPFDRHRSGFLFSQGGAAVLILESYDHAVTRGAPVVAELCAFSETSDSFNQMLPDPSGTAPRRMLQMLCDRSGVGLGDVDYVNAHGSGTEANDEMEVMLLEQLFGRSVRINSSKSLLGHSIGASGALEALITVLSVRDQRTHPCRNLCDPIRELNFVTDRETFPIRHALSHSFAFGGHNAGLMFRAV